MRTPTTNFDHVLSYMYVRCFGAAERYLPLALQVLLLDVVGRVALEVRVAQEPLRLHVEGAQVGGRLVALGLRLADARRAGGVRAPDDAAAFLQTQPSDGVTVHV